MKRQTRKIKVSHNDPEKKNQDQLSVTIMLNSDSIIELKLQINLANWHAIHFSIH